MRAGCLAVLLLLAACGGAAEAPIGPSFGAVLRASSEVVEPATTTGSGSAALSVRGKVIAYGITAINLSGPASGALHLGGAGSEGPAVVQQLFVKDPTTPRVRSRGSFQQSDIQPTTPGERPMTIDELIAQMRAGNVYVNVGTDESPAGEIRGQLKLTAEAPSPQSSSSSALQTVPE